AAIAAGLLSRSWVMRVLGALLVSILGMAYVDYNRAFYDLGFGGTGVPSPVLRALALNVELIGLPLWLLSRNLAGWAERRRSSRGADDGPAARYETPAAAVDAPFFLGFVVVGLAFILIPEAHSLLYYAFFKI